jgi:hypothetical protein
MKSRLFFLAIFGAVQLTAVAAQDTQFVQPLSSGDLSPNQNRALNQVKDLRSTEGDIQVVRINPAPLRDPRRSVTIPLPARSSVTLDSRDISDDRIVGQIAGLPDGTSTVAVNGDSVTGSIQTDSGLYRIRPLGGGAHAIFKVGRFPYEHPPSIERLRDQGARDLPPFERVPEADTSVTEIVVLVAYTPAVEAKVADVKGLVDLAFAETNASYKNSDIYIRLVQARSAPLKVDYQEAGSHDEDLEALKNPSDGKMDDVHQVRNQTKADIVVLLIDNGQYCGLASQIFANKDAAFAVVYHDCATGYYSFAHEIGHLQGARHNPEADPSIIPFSFGHGFMDRAHKRRTVMSYDCPDGCPRLPEWARPTEWGTRELHHDALVLNSTRRYVASFR